MENQLTLKQILIRIMMEFYKQEIAFYELEKKGVHLSRLLVKNMEIVLDVIGFPRNNSHEYDVKHEYFDMPIDEGKKPMDENYFPDEWLHEHYYNITRALSEEKNIVVTEEGIDVSGANNLHLVEEAMSKYIDWLYGEYEKYKRGEKPWESYLEDDEE